MPLRRFRADPPPDRGARRATSVARARWRTMAVSSRYRCATGVAAALSRPIQFMIFGIPSFRGHWTWGRTAVPFMLTIWSSTSVPR